MSKTAKQIITKWLTDNGYDGLCNTDCGCELSDLIPCGTCFDDCVPGYKVPCIHGGHDFDIATHREKKGESER